MINNIVFRELSFFLRDLRELRNTGDAEIHEYTIALTHKLLAVELLLKLYLPTTKKVQPTLNVTDKQDNIFVEEIPHYSFESMVYFESFLYFVTSMFDVLACVTYYLYRSVTNSIPQSSFKKQMSYFINIEPTRDAEYTGLLSKNKVWIDNVFENRDSFAHFFTPFFGLDQNGVIVFESRKPKETDPDRAAQFQSATDYMIETLKKINNVLQEYVRIQRRHVPETETTTRQRSIITESRFDFMKTTFFEMVKTPP